MTDCFYKQPPSNGFFGKAPVMSEVQRQEAIDYGKPYCKRDGDMKLTFYYYKDCWYLTEYEEIKNDRRY